MRLVVQVGQHGGGGRVGRIKHRDWAQLHMADHQSAFGVLGHGALSSVGVAVHAPAGAAGNVQEPQHVATGQGRDVGLFRVYRRGIRVGQGHHMGRRGRRHGGAAIKLPLVAAVVALVQKVIGATGPDDGGGVRCGHG